MCDYVGQRLDNLVGSFVLQQKKAYSPVAYGYINSLVLIVDLHVKKEDKDADPIPLIAPAHARVKRNIEEWSSMALDAIFGLLTDQSLRYICIFINKLDLMATQTDEAKQKIMLEYQPLINELQSKAFRDKFNIDVKVIIGSARSGAGVPQLKDDLVKFSSYP